MKKLIVSLVMFVGLVTSANATLFSSLVKVAPMPAAFIGFVALAQTEYKVCNDLPYVTVKAANGNYFYDVSQCDTKK